MAHFCTKPLMKQAAKAQLESTGKMRNIFYSSRGRLVYIQEDKSGFAGMVIEAKRKARTMDKA